MLSTLVYCAHPLHQITHQPPTMPTMPTMPTNHQSPSPGMEAAKLNVKQAKEEHTQSVKIRDEYIAARNTELKEEAEALRQMVADATAAQLEEDKEKIARISAENAR
jgi:hypothetical protein